MDNDLEQTAELYDNDNEEEVEKAWKEWKQTFEKSYGTPEEEERRKKAWLDTRALITEHNKEYLEGRESYSMGVNQFTDMLPGELPPMGHLSSPSEERGALVQLGGHRLVHICQDCPRELALLLQL